MIDVKEIAIIFMLTFFIRGLIKNSLPWINSQQYGQGGWSNNVISNKSHYRSITRRGGWLKNCFNFITRTLFQIDFDANPSEDSDESKNAVK